MRCKHPIFNMTRFQLQTPGGRASHPDLHPSETKALTDGRQLPYEPVGGTDMTKFLPPFQWLNRSIQNAATLLGISKK